jgi:hypothetical protein
MRCHLSPLIVSISSCAQLSAQLARAQYVADQASVPSDIKVIFDAPRYQGAVWGCA